MKYSKSERSGKPQPEIGWHSMKIVREIINERASAFHTFILEDPAGHTALFWNCWIRELDSIAKAANVPVADDGSIDTGHFVGKELLVLVNEKFSKAGKAFKTVVEYQPAPTNATFKTGTNATEVPF